MVMMLNELKHKNRSRSFYNQRVAKEDTSLKQFLIISPDCQQSGNKSNKGKTTKATEGNQQAGLKGENTVSHHQSGLATKGQQHEQQRDNNKLFTKSSLRICVSLLALCLRFALTLKKTRPDTRLPKSRAGRQGPYLRSPDHLGKSSEVKKIKS